MKPFGKTSNPGWAVAISMVFLCVGFGSLYRYSNQPGRQGPHITRWPAMSRLTPPRHGSKLIVFLHPKCPCSQATLSELNSILEKLSSPLDAEAVFYMPAQLASSWQDSSLIKKARNIRGLKVVLDSNGTEAKKFHAVTSGITFLFNSVGELIFSGGITAARGHEGENYGSNQIGSYLAGGIATLKPTSVFGCALSEN